MADKISLLPDNVANQIAAGEVVQRPSSVVKEMLENAADSGATKITLLIKEGGNLLIQIIDNGCGMSHTDARMCWERHATSKIRKAEDLYQIKTFGFRGEALASIASVAMVEMQTKMKENELATAIVIEGGSIKKHEFCAAANGTNIAVKNLFYNLPARRNFLKSIPVETKHVMEEFIRAAISHPGIWYTFINNDKEVLDFPVSDHKTRALSVFGKIKHTQLLEVKEETDLVKITGYIGVPEIAKKSRNEQFLFANSRNIKDPYLQHAIKQGYQNLLPPENHPVYVVFLEVAPERIDVNVHPSKTEVKFEDEKVLYSILMSTIKKTLGSFLNIPETFTFPDPFQNNSFKIQSSIGSKYSPEPKINPRFNPFNEEIQREKSQLKHWDKLFDTNVDKVNFSSHNENNLENAFSTDFFDYKQTSSKPDTVFQYADVLVVKKEESLFLVNILLARERIWYEKYLGQMEKKHAGIQKLLFPKTLVFSPMDAELLLHFLEDLRRLGFDLGEFGKNTFILNGLPADMPKGDEQILLETVLNDLKDNKQKHGLAEKENLARSMSKNAAAFAPKILSLPQQEALVQELFACNFPKYCPFGRNIYAQLNRQELNQLFKI